MAVSQTLGYFIENWRSDVVSLGVFSAFVIVLSGYFYGRLYQRFIPALRKIDTTIFGVLTIFALFQLEIYWSIGVDAPTRIAYTWQLVILLAAPLLCLLTRANVVPSWRHLSSVLIGIGIAFVLCRASGQWNTNNIYYDSVTYLSMVTESSSASKELFAHMVPYSGAPLRQIDPLHDLSGFYYFWGMVLRRLAALFDLRPPLVPIYIWGATWLYGMCLGQIITASVNALFKKTQWFYGLFIVLLLSPFYTNYWNTTLAFFGNTMRPLAVGAMLLAVYILLQSRDWKTSIPLWFVFQAAIDFSSTGLILGFYVCVSLFTAYVWKKETSVSKYIGWGAACYPIFQYAAYIAFLQRFGFWLATLLSLLVLAVLLLLLWLLSRRMPILWMSGKVVIVLLWVGMCVLSFVMKDRTYGYTLFFARPSAFDMALDLTQAASGTEMVRNILLWASFAALAFAYRQRAGMKLFYLAVFVLFLNPLVVPFLANTITSDVYARSFDLLINPFTLAFLVWNWGRILQVGQYLVLPALSLAAVVFLTVTNLTVPVSSLLTDNPDDYDWETKVGRDSFAMYTYIIDHIADEMPSFLSQDISLKGYVGGVQILFSSNDYRSALSHMSDQHPDYDMVSMLFPNNRFGFETNEKGDTADFSKLSSLLQKYDPDYLLISNTMSVWDKRGWYDKAYLPVLNNGQCEMVYENHSWALLKVDHAWRPTPKSGERYWVHKIDLPNETNNNEDS